MKAGPVVAVVGALLHLPLAVMTVVGAMEDILVVILTGPSLLAAALAVAGVVVARRRPRAGALLVLLPGLASFAWLLFLGLMAPGALLFLLGVPLLPLGGWLMRRDVVVENPLPELPGTS